jgi:hypothetical protein
VRIIAIDRAGRTRGAILVACVVLAAAGCRPDYAKLEACTPAELVEIMRGGWRVNRGAAGAELSLLAMRKPEIVRPVSDTIHELLDSPYPETRRWATCVLLEIDRYRQDATSSAQSMLSDKGKDDIATENRSKVLYHLAKNPAVLGECRDLVIQNLSDEYEGVIQAAVYAIDRDTQSNPLDNDAAVVRLLELCHTNHGGWQSHSLDALSRVTPRLRATVAQGLSTVTVLPGNEKRFAAAVEATSRREDEG